MREKSEKNNKNRIFIVLILVFCVFIGFGVDLVKIQLLDGSEYASSSASVSSRSVTIKPARGEILDRNGNALVSNKQVNSIIFEAALFPPLKEQGERNKIISSLISLFEASGVEWNDKLPVEFDAAGKPVFATNRELDIKYLKSRDMLNLNDYATAENCLDALIEKYSLQEYPIVEARKIASVCYELRHIGFSISTPYTFADDVPTALVAKIKENSSFYRGVTVDIVTSREFADGTIAPHILGMVGAIDAEEYAEKKDEGYSINDTIGKSGIESAMESYLRGSPGSKLVTTDAQGKVTTTVTREPEQGNSVILTIDKNLQVATQKALEQGLKRIDTQIKPAGAALVIDVNTFEVLACATYPSYDAATYRQNYAELAQNENAPLWNRALMSTYEPGSTIKPSVAIAALEEGVITKDTVVYCSGTYKYLDSFYKCEQRHSSRKQNVTLAIDESCNSFFYECGKRLGYAKINEYRTMFGLAQKTGIELPESIGVMDSPEYRESVGSVWWAGYNIQTAIGQGNLFTPIQLGVYCSTIANGGTRYRAHFVKAVKTDNNYETVLENKPEVLCNTGVSKNTLDIVRSAMLRVGSSGGYLYKDFKNLGIKIAAKTGTSQVTRTVNGHARKINNAFVISFGPYENPDIAVVVCGEGVSSSVTLGPIVADIYRAYLKGEGSYVKNQSENQLLG
ncbi:MAG: hypothetical protein K5756_02305 [Clostridiales bacterium]|nr:hypothetical protein [Clostridiales bacterium]